MVLELSVGHSSCVAIDDVEVGCADTFCGDVTIGRRRIELTCGMPFFSFSLFLCVLFFGVVKLLMLVTNAPVDERTSHCNVIKKQYKDIEYVVVKYQRSLL